MAEKYLNYHKYMTMHKNCYYQKFTYQNTKKTYFDKLHNTTTYEYIVLKTDIKNIHQKKAQKTIKP